MSTFAGILDGEEREGGGGEEEGWGVGGVTRVRSSDQATFLD